MNNHVRELSHSDSGEHGGDCEKQWGDNENQWWR